MRGTVIRYVAAAMLLPGIAAAQTDTQVVITRHEVITGHITTDSGKPIPQAQVIATRAPDRLSVSALTDQNGKYTIEFSAGTGDYLVYVAAPLWSGVRKRLTRRRNATASDTLFVFDTSLVASAQPSNTLPTVRVSAERPRIWRENAPGPGVGGADEGISGLKGVVPPGLAGNLPALAATTPGVSPLAGGGFSVLGLKPSDNTITLNGFAFQGADVPRDARTTTRVIASAFDPSVGWFSGAEVATTLDAGDTFSARRSHITIDAPLLEMADNSQRSGGRFTRVEASLGGDGAITNDDRYVYSYGLQGGHRVDPISSLSDLLNTAPRYTNVPMDSVTRLRQQLVLLGIPLSPRGNPVSRASDNLSFIGRIDHAPYDWTTFTPAKTVWGLLGYAKLQRSEAETVGPTTTTASGGSSAEQSMMLQAMYSSYDSAGRLTDGRSALSFARSSSTPYYQLPAGNVLVSSLDSSGTAGSTLFQFGAAPELGARTDTWIWETVGNRQFFADRNARHRIKVTADARLDAAAVALANNQFGTFTYQSIGDLSANAPSSFTRTTGSGDAYGSVGNVFVAAGDYWTLSDRLRVLYGIRLDADRFLSHLSDNQQVAQLLGVRTGNEPSNIALSPRLGFTWVKSPSSGGLRGTSVGTFTMGPRQSLSGGIGEFRNIVSPAEATGLSAFAAASAAQRLTCVGSAVPVPDWPGYLADPASIPSQCLQTGPMQFVSDAPDVRFLDSSFEPSHSWRANLSYSAMFSKLVFSMQALYSLNLGQRSIADLNFGGIPKFTLADEGDRPVYVSAAAFDPASGISSDAESRRFSNLGRVEDVLSDGRSASRQFSITLSPDLSNLGNWFASVTYTHLDVRQRERGFDAPTFQSPATQEWAPGDFFSRHQFLIQAGFGSDNFAVTMFGRIASGMSFTPTVSADINGDGLLNDRAFIFNPPSAPDPALGTALRELIGSSSGRIHDCLERQLGRPAARNSCTGPWTASLDAQLSATGKALHLGKRVNVVLSFANPLGGIDELIHGQKGLHGWGTPAFPDPVLYQVRGFDPAARRFNYDVNSRFGSTAAANALLRVPFRVTLDVSVDLGTPIPVQQLEKWMSRGRNGRTGKRLSAEEIKQRYMRNVPDPYSDILAQNDSLLLSDAQVAALQAVDESYLARVDTVWTRLAEYLAGLGDGYDGKTAVARAEAATSAVWELTRLDVQRTLPGILNPIQLRLMPAAGLFRSRGPITGRTYRF